MPTSLVTGGAGFIGSHVTDYLISMGHKVLVVDDLSGGSEQNIPKTAIFSKGSILDQHFLGDVFNNFQIDYVYHLAAYAAEGLSHFIKSFNYQNNVVGSVNLINEAVKHQIKCFVFTSSIAVYGNQQSPVTESMTPMPEDSYGIAKWTVEQELKISKEMFGLDYVIFRPHNVYGERQNICDPYRNVVGIFMNQLLLGKSLPIFGDGSQTRAFTYISDVTETIAQSALRRDMYGETFNIGADQVVSVRKLAEMIMEKLGIDAELKFLDKRKEVGHIYASHKKMENCFGLRATVSLDEGLIKMADWVKRTEHLPSKKFSTIEITKNLPTSWM